MKNSINYHPSIFNEESFDGSIYGRLKNRKLIIEEVSDSFSELINIPIEELLGSNFFKYLGDESRQRMQIELFNKDFNESITRIPLVLRNKELTLIHVDILLSRQINESDITTGFVANFINREVEYQLTEYKNMCSRFHHKNVGQLLDLDASSSILVEDIIHCATDTLKIWNILCLNSAQVFNEIIRTLRKICSLSSQIIQFIKTHKGFNEIKSTLEYWNFHISRINECVDGDEKGPYYVEIKAYMEEFINWYANQEFEHYDELELNEIKKNIQYLCFLNMLFIAYRFKERTTMILETYLAMKSYRNHTFNLELREPINYQSININDLIQDVINTYQFSARVKGLQIERIIEESVIRGSKNHLRLMLSYVVHNAIKYSYSGTMNINRIIQIRTFKLSDHIMISVKNFGVGILPHEISSDLIFKYGYRGELSWDSNRTGSGLGLSTAKLIAELHNGSIAVRSNPVNKKEHYGYCPYITEIIITLPKRGDNIEKSFMD